MIKITKKELDKKLDLFSGATFTGEYYHMSTRERENIKKWLLNEFDVELEEELKVAYMEFRNWSNGGKIDKLYFGFGEHTTCKEFATKLDTNNPISNDKLEELKSRGWKVEDYE